MVTAISEWSYVTDTFNPYRNADSDQETSQSLRAKSRAEIMREYGVRTISRKEFLAEFKRERKGKPPHHLTMLGPTHRGKTTLELQLLKQIISPDCQVILLSAKPNHRDPVMNDAAKQLNLVVIDHWPPTLYERKKAKHQKKCGWVVRPEQTMTDLDADHDNVQQNFRRAMLDAYNANSKCPIIIVHDEAHKIYNVYGLKKEYEAPLMSGLPDNASHSLIQRGRFMPYLAYDSPEDIIIFNDPDLSNQRRYAEIGGVDPTVVVTITKGLKTYETKDGHTISEFLHVRRAGPRLTVVGIE